MDAKRLSDLRIEYQTYGPLKEIVEDLLDDAKEMGKRFAALEAKCKELTEALDFYAYEGNWTPAEGQPHVTCVSIDGGERARAALAQEGENDGREES